MLKLRIRWKNPPPGPSGNPRWLFRAKTKKSEKLLFPPHFGREKNYSLSTSSRTLIQAPMILNKPDRALFWSIFGLKRGKKGQHVERLPEFSPGWIFCFSLVFNYFSLFLHFIFVKSLNFEIESCTEPKTLGRSIDLDFASHSSFWCNGSQFLVKLAFTINIQSPLIQKKLHLALFSSIFYPK